MLSFESLERVRYVDIRTKFARPHAASKLPRRVLHLTPSVLVQRYFLESRFQLRVLTHLVTLFFEHRRHGVPIIRCQDVSGPVVRRSLVWPPETRFVRQCPGDAVVSRIRWTGNRKWRVTQAWKLSYEY